MDRFSCMRAFCDVVACGGFSAAARKTNHSKALLSKYVAQLEEQLGVRLLNRTTRKVTPTADGMAYYQRCRELLEALVELEGSVREQHDQPRGELRISAPVSFAELKLVPLLDGFLTRYPELSVRLQLSDRMVDMVDAGLDVAIRVADLPDSSLVARKLMPMRIVACASPGYLETMGTPHHPTALQQHRCILDTNLEDFGQWGFVERGVPLRVRVTGQVAVNSATAVRQLVLQGYGVALCPLFVVEEDIAAGRLRPLLEVYEPGRHFVYALYPHRRHLSTKVRVLIDYLLEQLA